MAYQFNKPKSTNKPIHIVFTSLIALLAIVVLCGWLVLSYLTDRPTEQPEETETTSTTSDEVTLDVATCLVILDMNDSKQFLLVHTNPQAESIIVAAVPAQLDTGSGDTLSELLARSGPTKVMQTVAERLELPLSHYISLSHSGVNKFANELENGITVKLPETVKYTDENGITSTISAGTSTLTAGDTTAVLSHNKWKKKQYSALMATRITAAMFNSYLTPEYSVRGYFGALSNVATTDLRIDNFVAYKSALTHLAEANTGEIASIVELDGQYEKGRFYPNIDSCRRNSGLYH